MESKYRGVVCLAEYTIDELTRKIFHQKHYIKSFDFLYIKLRTLIFSDISRFTCNKSIGGQYADIFIKSGF